MKPIQFCRRAKSLARTLIQGWYEKVQPADALARLVDPGRLTWIGAAADEYFDQPLSLHEPSVLQHRQDDLPALIVDEENWHFTLLDSSLALVYGHYRLRTAPESGLVLSEMQRATLLIAADGSDLRLLHLHISAPFGVRRRRPYVFQERESSYEYMGEFAVRQWEGLFPELTRRQQKVLYFLTRGLSYKEIADILGITPRTVRYYVSELEHRLHVENRAQLIVMAERRKDTGGGCNKFLWKGGLSVFSRTRSCFFYEMPGTAAKSFMANSGNNRGVRYFFQRA